MKNFTLIMVAICCPILAFCQDITGLWKGTLYNDSTQQSSEYEILVTKEKGKYTAYSRTAYLVDNKEYFGIKKINVRVAKDGKIVMQDAKLVEENYPGQPNKNVIQLNVLDLAADAGSLEGLFVTNRSKDYRALTGRVTIKKVNPLTPSNLVSYLQKNSNSSDLTVSK